MVICGQGGFIRAKMLYSDKCGCIWAKVVLLGQSDAFGQDGCIRGKVVLLEQECLYSGKVVLFGQMWL